MTSSKWQHLGSNGAETAGFCDFVSCWYSQHYHLPTLYFIHLGEQHQTFLAKNNFFMNQYWWCFQLPYFRQKSIVLQKSICASYFFRLLICRDELLAKSPKYMFPNIFKDKRRFEGCRFLIRQFWWKLGTTKKSP